jgi:hypothetical protein
LSIESFVRLQPQSETEKSKSMLLGNRFEPIDDLSIPDIPLATLQPVMKYLALMLTICWPTKRKRTGACPRKADGTIK